MLLAASVVTAMLAHWVDTAVIIGAAPANRTVVLSDGIAEYGLAVDRDEHFIQVFLRRGKMRRCRGRILSDLNHRQPRIVSLR